MNNNSNNNNNNIIAIHITNQCNLRCSLCYQKKENKVIKYEYIQKAIKIFNPEYVVLFGGEAILYPNLIKKFHKDYPTIKIILHTNGTIYNPKIFNIVSILYLTVDSFFYSYNKIHRNMTYSQYKIFLKTIQYYKDKIEIIHNIYPNSNDIAFYKMVHLLQIFYSDYPIVSAEKEIDLSNIKFYKSILYRRNSILINPKIRILVDGTVTRDMTGHFNICHIDNYKLGMDCFMPISDICKKCSCYKKCFACNLFPHFCKLVLDKINYEPAFCKFSKHLIGE